MSMDEQLRDEVYSLVMKIDEFINRIYSPWGKIPDPNVMIMLFREKRKALELLARYDCGDRDGARREREDILRDADGLEYWAGEEVGE